MSAQPKIDYVSPEEYFALDRASEERLEYYSGEMVAMSGASLRHETIVVNLTREISNALRGKPCKPKGGNLRVRARKSNYLYADLTVVCGEPKFADGEYLDTLLNPTVIFEILSESTQSKDFGIKRRLYQEIESLKHYVLIHQDIARVEIYTRQGDFDWLLHPETSALGAVMLSAVGVTLSLSDIYEDVIVEQESVDHI